MFAWTQPSGTIEAAAYDQMKQELLEAIDSAWPLDGLYLDLHGAGVAEGISDLEGDLVKAIRERVGSIPVVATFDLHGNVTQAMADQPTAYSCVMNIRTSISIFAPKRRSNC